MLGLRNTGWSVEVDQSGMEGWRTKKQRPALTVEKGQARGLGRTDLASEILSAPVLFILGFTLLICTPDHKG